MLSGAGYLDREVRWVHSAEESYIASMLKGGELLLMTGVGLGRSAAALRRFVTELTDRGVAAVAIELGPRFPGAPEPLVRAAQEHNLIVIVFHREIPFVEITEVVHAEIISGQLTLLRRSEEVHQRFYRLALDGAGTPEILATLAEITGGPVFLERMGHGLVYHAAGGRNEPEVLAEWDAYARGLSNAPPGVERHVPAGTSERWGRVVALTGNEVIDEFARAAVERAVELVALAMLRDREEERLRARERGNFLTGLLRGEFSDSDANTHAAAMGLQHSDQLVPVIACRSPLLSGRAEASLSWSRTWVDVQTSARRRGMNVVAGTREDDREFLAVLGVASGTEAAREAVVEELASLIHHVCEHRLADADAVFVCAGASATNWAHLARSLGALAEALPVAANRPVRPWHDLAVPTLDHLLFRMREDEQLTGFIEARLSPLLRVDQRRSSDLLRTLEVYCQQAGRKAEAARALNIERQSMYHRLGKIEKILAVDLSDGDVLTDLHFAIRAHRTVTQA